MLLFEILAGANKRFVKKIAEFWVQYNRPKIHFFPRYSNSWQEDLMSFYGADKLGDNPTWDELKPIRAKIERLTKVDYSQNNSHGWFLVTPGVVNFDVSRFSGTQNRRRNTKIGKHHDDKNGEIPILMGEITFNRIIDMVKVLKALVSVKPETAEYKVVGDDRVRGLTVKQIIDGGAQKYDHTRAFAGTVQDLVMFHGTSQKRATNILSSGLLPLKRETTYADLIPGYSSKNVYLTLSPSIAANYATREAINDESDAAILEVTLTPMQVMKLLPDEDTMSWFEYLPDAYKNRFFKKHPAVKLIWGSDKAFNVHIKNIDHKKQEMNLEWLFDEPSYGDRNADWKKKAVSILKDHGYNRTNLESLQKELYVDLMNTFIDSMKVSSLKKSGTVAYPGGIPSSQIKVIKTWSLKNSRMKSDADSKTYNDASETQERSMKYH